MLIDAIFNFVFEPTTFLLVAIGLIWVCADLDEKAQKKGVAD